MIQIKKIFVILLSLFFLVSSISINGITTQAADSTTHKLKVKLSGSKTVRVTSGKKNVTKKTIQVTKGDKVNFSFSKNKNVKSVTYKTMNKKYVTITKKGKATAKKVGTAKIKITIKRKTGKSISTWVKIKVKKKAETDNAGKTLVLYFSRAGENYNVGVVEKGSTQIVAEMIAEETGADLFKLETVTPYPEDYSECVEVTRKEKSENARPELKAVPDNLAEYEKIYIGYPIWHADIPMALYTFLENYDLSGKTILPFCTHAGSGLAGTVSTFREKCKDATVTEGFAIAGTTVQADSDTTKNRVKEWIQNVNP